MNDKTLILNAVRRRACDRLARLAGVFARAPSAHRESLHAGIVFERWLAEACDDALDGRE